MSEYLARHAQVFFYSLGQLFKTPFATAMTVAMLGVAIAVPLALYIAAQNLTSLSEGWDVRPQISLFLEKSVSNEAGQQLANEINQREEIEQIQFVPADRALEEFEQASGFGSALNLLDENPLPSVIVVFPATDSSSTEQVQELKSQLAQVSGVESAQIDLEWLRRLSAVFKLARYTVLLLAILLGAGVVLIVSNTVRLAIATRRDEIEIIDQIGGTHAFIRRPFLYTGIQLGFMGAVVALIVVLISLILLNGPVAELARLYGSEYQLAGPTPLQMGIVIVGGAFLSWLAARITVWRHLAYLKPEH